MRAFGGRKIPILIISASAIVLSGAAALIIRGVASHKEFKDTLPIDSVLTAEQALEDFDYIYRTISENHVCFLDGSGLDRAFFEEYNAQRSALAESAGVTITDLWRSAAEMCHILGDAHTLAAPSRDMYAEDLSVLREGTVVSVDGVPCGELLEEFRSIFSYEPQVDFYADHMFGQVIIRKNYLELLGIDTSDGADYEIQTGSETVTEHYNFVSAAEVRGNESGGEELCGYIVDKENSIGIFTLNECVLNDEYKNALKNFFGEVAENDISAVAVDLRDNGGGNSLVINEFFRYLDVDEYRVFGGTDVRRGGRLKSYSGEFERNRRVKEPFDGELYVLTSNFTFSSAMNFAAAVSDNNIGTVIGETPGNMPAHYGDMLTFQCPNSGLLIKVSYKKFHRIDSAKDEMPLIPDIEVEADKAIEALYETAAKGEG